MSKKTETANTQDLIGAIVNQEGKQGAFRVTEYNKGWLTLENEQGEQHKARAGVLTVVAHEDGDDAADKAEVARKMASTLNRYKPMYVQSVAASGAKSQNNGDDLAAFLSALTPEAVAILAEKVLGLEPGFLVAKYERLNPGQMRMNSGNRIRAAIKRGELTTEAVRKAYTNN